MPWSKRIHKQIPSLTSRSRDYELDDYSKGINNFLSNDTMPLKSGESNYWRAAQDARIPTLGEYETRKGADFHSAAVGETLDVSETSVTGAADQSFNTTTRLAMKFSAVSSGRLPKVELNLKNSASAAGVIIVEVYTNSSGAPGTLLARSSIASSAVTGSYAYVVARFVDAPVITTAEVYWIVAYVQDTATGSYKWSSTTNATTALSSTDSGSTWSSTSYALNFKQYYATNAPSKGLFRASKSDGTKKTLLAAGTTLSSVNDSDGVLTTIKSGLDASATNYRGVVVNDTFYYVNGYDGLRKWNFTTESQVTASDYSLIAEHKGLLFLVDSLDPNKVIFSNFADYETFTSTDFIYVPSPKSGDPIVAINSVNGVLAIQTRKTKYILYGVDNATFQLQEAPASGRKGTFTQETTASDDNYLYFLGDDGVYRFNGTQDELLSKDIYEDIKNLNEKDNACLVVNKGRLHMFYTPAGSSVNTSAIVWNLNFNAVESYDTGTYFNRAITCKNDDDKMLVASALIGQAHWNELSTNDYTNLGGLLTFQLTTHYMHFGSPSRESEVRAWKARFRAQSDDYAVSCQYAYDFRDNYQTVQDLDVQGAGTTWGGGSLWGGFTWGTTSELQGDLSVPGQYRRISLRYTHTAARQPHGFLGQTLVVQNRRLR